MIRSSAIKHAHAASGTSGVGVTAIRPVARPRRRPRTYTVIYKPSIRGLATSSGSSAPKSIPGPQSSVGTVPSSTSLSTRRAYPRAGNKSGVTFNRPEVQLMAPMSSSSSSPITRSSTTGSPTMDVDDDVIYRKEGDKIVRVESGRHEPKLPVSGLFSQFHSSQAEPLHTEQEKIKPSKTTDTVDVSTLTLRDVLPNDQLLQQLITQSKVNASLDEVKDLYQAVLKTLPLPEDDPKRVQVEKEFSNASKKMDAMFYMLASWPLRFSRDGAPLAAAIMKLAINNGDAYCRYPYAALLYRGAKGFPADRAKGRAYMEVLANPKNKRFKGIPVAMTALAGIYVREDKNYEGARDLYVKAAHAGEPQASVALGRMYLSGELPRDTAMARKYFEIATKSDESSPEAHFLLGSMEMDQEKPNFKGAFQHFQKAASKGLPEAQYNVGLAYFRGVGVPKNDALAIEYWKMSGQQGFGLAQLSLGAYYFQNEEPPKEPEEERAVGSTKTAFRHEWDLSKRDLSQAQKWFTLASRRPGDLGLEGARLKAQVEEAIKKGGGGRRQDRPCTIM